MSANIISVPFTKPWVYKALLQISGYKLHIQDGKASFNSINLPVATKKCLEKFMDDYET